jgi:branched-chain amino acid transport system ATP-binding protein
MAVLLELDGVSKLYGALKAVDAVSLAVADGEALAVIGPNGAGKSTMFNLITGDVAPTGGRIMFGSSDITAMAPHARSRLGIGRSYQIPHPFANMSVFENLLVGAIFGGGATERESYKSRDCTTRPTCRRGL